MNISYFGDILVGPQILVCFERPLFFEMITYTTLHTDGLARTLGTIDTLAERSDRDLSKGKPWDCPWPPCVVVPDLE